MTRPKTEVELSPLVQQYWEARGYCVHGEVAVFKKSIFIDHVAHLGPCSCPEHLVGIEMKVGAGQNLRRQISSLDTYHVVDDLFGAVINTPNAKTLEAWETLSRWNRPGLLVWEGGQLVEVQPCVEHRPYRYPMKRDRVLLVEENQGVLAGYPSSHPEACYHTHWSRMMGAARHWAGARQEPFTLEDLQEAAFPHLHMYKNATTTLRSVLRTLEDEGTVQRLRIKRGRKALYQKG